LATIFAVLNTFFMTFLMFLFLFTKLNHFMLILQYRDKKHILKINKYYSQWHFETRNPKTIKIEKCKLYWIFNYQFWVTFTLPLFVCLQNVCTVRAASVGLLLPAEAAKTAAWAAETAAQDGEEEQGAQNTQANPNPYHVLAVRVQGVLSVAVL